MLKNDPAYGAFIAKLSSKAVADLGAADGDTDLLRAAILSYLQNGYRWGLGPSELIDFFCVSTPNIVEDAGYSDTAGNLVVELFDEVHNEFRRSGLIKE